MLGSGQGCSWGTGECVSGAWGCFGVFSGVLGLFEGVGGLRGVSGSLLPSFPFNVRKSQMRILNFFSRPEDPKCLKYPNVPKLGPFWAIGKPWERFQSWDIRIYFIPVPNDHTVVQFGILIVNDSTTQCHNYHWALYHINTSFIVSSTSTFNGEDESHFCHVTSLRKYLKKYAQKQQHCPPDQESSLCNMNIQKSAFVKYMHAP